MPDQYPLTEERSDPRPDQRPLAEPEAPPEPRAWAEDFPRSTARIAGHPIHPMLVPIPITCFVGALICDIVYWRTADMQWANFSAWLLTAGLVVAFFAVIAGLTDFIAEPRIRALGAAWIHGVGNAIALVLAIVNVLLHTRDAYTSVVPWGLVLSVLTVLILLVTGWNGGEMVYRHGVGQRPAAWR